jgi:tetratricopeptide (TPR) repeat protein
MKSTFLSVTMMFVFAGLISSGFLLAGCKKEQPKESGPSTQTQSPAGTAKDEQSARQEARLNLTAGLNYIKDGNYDKAIKEFTVAIEKYPKYDIAYSDRAAAFIQQKKFNEAEADLKKALEINPNSLEAHYNLAALYSIQNKLDSSLQALERALELGLKDAGSLRDDTDLNNVRKRPEFRKLLKKYKISVSK